MISQEVIKAIEAALDKGLRVELIKDKDGNVKAQTISRKRLSPVLDVNAPKTQTRRSYSG